jgi:transposase
LAKPSPKELSKRRTHSPEFKARVAMEAISCRKTLQEIAADHAVHPIQVSQWKKQLLEGASDLVTRGKKTQTKDEARPRRLSCPSRSAGSRWSWRGRKKSQLL